MSIRSATLEPNYKIMAELRYQIRRFLHFGELTAREAGLEPQQYQLMLVLKGPSDGFRGSIAEIAGRLLIQHHSTVELVDRMVRRGMVRRRRGTEDRREVLIELTTRGEKLLRELALRHREELRLAGPEMVGALKKLLRETPGDDAPVRRKTKRGMAKN